MKETLKRAFYAVLYGAHSGHRHALQVLTAEACTSRNPELERYGRLVDELTEVGREFERMAKQQAAIVDSYTERRQFPKRLNRYPSRLELQTYCEENPDDCVAE